MLANRIICSLVLTNLLRSIPMSWRVSRSLMGSLSGCRLLIFTGGRNLRKISRKTIVLLEGSRFSDFVICNSEYLHIFLLQGAIKIYKLPLPKDLDDFTVMGNDPRQGFFQGNFALREGFKNSSSVN